MQCADFELRRFSELLSEMIDAKNRGDDYAVASAGGELSTLQHSESDELSDTVAWIIAPHMEAIETLSDVVSWLERIKGEYSQQDIEETFRRVRAEGAD
jgi:hypothetical protein